MSKVKAKFRCESVTDFGQQKRADLRAVTTGSDENKTFAKFTPSGTLSVTIDDETPAAGFFKPGEEYTLLFEKAEN